MINTTESLRKLPEMILCTDDSDRFSFAGSSSIRRPHFARVRGTSGVTGFDGITRKPSKSQSEDVEGGKARGKSLRVLGARSASARALFARFWREDARDGAEETRVEARGDGDNGVDGDARTHTVAVDTAGTGESTRSVSNKPNLMLGSPTTHEATAAGATVTAVTTIGTTESQEKVRELTPISGPRKTPTGPSNRYTPSAEESATSHKDRWASGSTPERMIWQRVGPQPITRKDTVREKERGTSRAGSMSSSASSRDGKGEESDKKTAIAKIGGMLAALPLSKLKIVIGKHNCLSFTLVCLTFEIAAGHGTLRYRIDAFMMSFARSILR